MRGKFSIAARNTGPVGWRLRRRHFEAVTSFIKCCRKFFPSGSAAEIWSEFRDFTQGPKIVPTYELFQLKVHLLRRRMFPSISSKDAKLLYLCKLFPLASGSKFPFSCTTDAFGNLTPCTTFYYLGLMASYDAGNRKTIGNAVLNPEPMISGKILRKEFIKLALSIRIAYIEFSDAQAFNKASLQSI
ncbi:hypothetical protein C5167_021218 [Papaver somniferum]|uniref:Uncharacterized protein n=1 Tax=Papaver somniferum TaxID=3469 RepID=A0A4Y7IVX7_PAPSO|nr:hypothetical protein C5167_021218 [Papaver somniferum]